MNELLDKIAVLMRELQAQYGKGTISVGIYPNDGVTVDFHTVGTYSEATEFMQSLGIGERKKTIIDDTARPWCSLTGKNASGLTVQAFCNGLPPSCKLEIYTERVPKTQTVETDGFVEIERRRVVCGKGDA